MASTGLMASAGLNGFWPPRPSSRLAERGHKRLSSTLSSAEVFVRRLSPLLMFSFVALTVVAWSKNHLLGAQMQAGLEVASLSSVPPLRLLRRRDLLQKPQRAGNEPLGRQGGSRTDTTSVGKQDALGGSQKGDTGGSISHVEAERLAFPEARGGEPGSSKNELKGGEFSRKRMGHGAASEEEADGGGAHGGGAHGGQGHAHGSGFPSPKEAGRERASEARTDGMQVPEEDSRGRKDRSEEDEADEGGSTEQEDERAKKTADGGGLNSSGEGTDGLHSREEAKERKPSEKGRAELDSSEEVSEGVELLAIGETKTAKEGTNEGEGDSAQGEAKPGKSSEGEDDEVDTTEAEDDQARPAGDTQDTESSEGEGTESTRATGEEANQAKPSQEETEDAGLQEKDEDGEGNAEAAAEGSQENVSAGEGAKQKKASEEHADEGGESGNNASDGDTEGMKASKGAADEGNPSKIGTDGNTSSGEETNTIKASQGEADGGGSAGIEERQDSESSSAQAADSAPSAEETAESRAGQSEASDSERVVAQTAESQAQALEEEFTCIRKNRRSDYCIMKGDVRLHQRLNLFVLYARKASTRRGKEKLRPYTRKGDKFVEDSLWTFTARSMDAPGDASIPQRPEDEVVDGTLEMADGHWDIAGWRRKSRAVLDNEGKKVGIDGHWELFPEPPPGKAGPADGQLPTLHCDVQHKVPAVLYTTGGYTGNIYHEFADGILPLWITARPYGTEVILAIAEWHWSWLRKYAEVLPHLSKYPPLLLGKSNEIHCFPEAIVGQVAHDEFVVNPALMPHGETIQDFQKIFAAAYNKLPAMPLPLERERSGALPADCMPLLTIIVRRQSRVLCNKAQVIHWAQQAGFAVRVLEPRGPLALRHVWAALQETDVMLGVHGAAMTHFVFMRPHSVFIQLVPLSTGWASSVYYGDPSKELGLQYVHVNLLASESSLSSKYSPNDRVLTDPQWVYDTQGYSAVKSIYMDGQNVTWSKASARVTLKEARQKWLQARHLLEPSARDLRCQAATKPHGSTARI